MSEIFTTSSAPRKQFSRSHSEDLGSAPLAVVPCTMSVVAQIRFEKVVAEREMTEMEEMYVRMTNARVAHSLKEADFSMTLPNEHLLCSEVNYYFSSFFSFHYCISRVLCNF